MARPVPAEELNAIVEIVRQYPGGVGLQDIAAALPGEVPVRTLQYRLQRLVQEGQLVREGERRWMRYSLPAAADPEMPAPAAPVAEGEGQRRVVRTIYCDESGFTGYNLLDPAQPIFVVASAGIEEQRAHDILTQSFPEYRGREFKFTNIWRSRNRAGLLTFAGHLGEFENLSFIYMIDKRFAVLTKIVDFLIEPYITDAGYDFYDDGFCWKYCNYIYFGLTQFGPPELFDALASHYQVFSRNPTPESLDRLHFQLGIMAASVEEELQIFFEQMAMGARLFHNYHDLEQFRGSDELQMTTMLAIVAHWRQRYPEDFSIVHDTSSNFLRSREMWGRITNNNVPAQQHRLGDGSFVEYPLRVVSTAAIDSRDSYSVQFCDILAGLTARHFNPATEAEDREFMNQIIDGGLQDITYNGIRPQHIFPDQIPPRRLAGPDVVDQMTEIMFGPHNENQ